GWACMPGMIVRVAVRADVTAATRREVAGAGVAAGHFARQQAGETTYLGAREDEEVLDGVVVVGTELRHLQVEAEARAHGRGHRPDRACRASAVGAGIRSRHPRRGSG